MKRSTSAFFREARNLQDYSLFDFMHGYVYARWPYLYIGVGTGEHPVARAYQYLVSRFTHRASGSGEDREQPRGMANTYHGKVLLTESAHALVRVEEDVELRDLERVLPYPTARDIVLKNPDHIVVLNCPCRSVRDNPCMPLDVCMIVGEPFASFILEHHPDRTRSLSRDQAIELLNQEHDRGHVHHAFFKDAMLGRFYAICNCCRCCCGALQAMRKGSPMISASGYSAQVDERACIGCESCIEVCNFDALQNIDGLTTVFQDKCMGCGLCVDKCLEGALYLERDASKGIPLEIERLMEAATVNASSRHKQPV